MSMRRQRSRSNAGIGGSVALIVLAGTLGGGGLLSGVPVAAAAERPLEAVDAELAGLPGGSRGFRLTWEQAYALALAASRAGEPAKGGGLTDVLDPEELLRRIERLEGVEFGRFRAEFLAEGQAGGKFRDPAGGMFAVLRSLQMVENARRNVGALERLLVVVRERIQGESSGLSQLDLDRVDAALQEARRGWFAAIRQYRDRLDELKVELGVAPGAPVVPDRENLAAFRDGFTAIDEWCREPNRDMMDLPRLVSRLPVLREVVIAGHPIFAVLGQTPDQLETVLATAARVARENRQGAAKGVPQDAAATAALELRVRRGLRFLVETHRAYLMQMRSLVLAVRLKDQAFERGIAPSPEGPFLPRSPLLKDLIDQEAEILRVQNDLFASWAAFQEGRLALYRDLGTLPYDDWKAFYEQLSARPSTDAPAVPPAPGRGIDPAPAPPAPLAPQAPPV